MPGAEDKREYRLPEYTGLHGRVFKMALYPIPGWADEVNDASIIPYDYDKDTGLDLYDEMFEGRIRVDREAFYRT